MSDALDLIGAVLGPLCSGPAAARDILESALAAEVDPLDYCAIEFNIPPTIVMQRAAGWAKFAFYPRVPDERQGVIEPVRLEMLAKVRMFRTRLIDREIVFAAPDFSGLLRLHKRSLEVPELATRLVLVPQQALRDRLAIEASQALLDHSRQDLARRWPEASAHLEVTAGSRIVFATDMVGILMLALLAPHVAQLWLFPLVLCLLVLPALLRLAAMMLPRPRSTPQVRPPDTLLPVYSVLVPLHNEHRMVPQLYKALTALDYPAARLDIKFVVEAASPKTVAAVLTQIGSDPRFSLLVVPDGKPRTKPKALNFALPLCRGDYVVVYDAEDIPEPSQLWKAAARFRQDPRLVCLQARLEVVNGDLHPLAALFAAEYAGLFSVLLPALAKWRLPMPLGGTSNHFNIAALRDLGGWDAFNVTEDADLGMRMARRRLPVDMLDSATFETAHTSLSDWIGQRTRWTKGWMLTFLVHNRHPLRLFREMGWLPFCVFEVLIFSMIMSPLLHVGFAMVLVGKIAAGLPVLDITSWGGFYATIFLLGYGSAILQTLMGLYRQRRWSLFAMQSLLPLYWIAMAVATVKAVFELLLQPYYWFKSPHRPMGGVSARIVHTTLKRRSGTG